jgi:hypothetical protein
MLRILLVYDNFQELTSVESSLKKVGFDVLGITSEFSLAEQLLAFNPHIVVGQGRSAKVSSSGVGKRLRESLRWDGQAILIFYSDAKPQPADILKMRMDSGLEHPVEISRLIQTISQLAGLDAPQLLEKLAKISSSDPTSKDFQRSQDSSGNFGSESDNVFVSGGTGPDGQELNQVTGAGFTPNAMVPIQDPLFQELENLLVGKPGPFEKPEIKDSKRAQVYASILKNQPPLGEATLSKKEAKARLRDLVDPLSKESLRNQDDLRREFVKALFKRGT